MKLIQRLTSIGVVLALVLAAGCAQQKKEAAPQRKAEPSQVKTQDEAQARAEMEQFEAQIKAQESSPPVGAGELDGLRLQFEPGAQVKARYASSEFYKTWVEIEGKQDTHAHSRETKDDVLFNVTVDKINGDGTAILRVDILEAQVTLSLDFPQKKTDQYYTSTAEKTDSNWDGEPALAGAVYHIRMAPDTTVEEIIDLKDLRRSLGFQDGASGAVSRLISKEAITRRHEREFVQFGAGPGRKNNQTSELFAVNETMLKAQAVKRTFTTNPIDADGIVTITSTGEAIHTLPQGFEEPPQPNLFGQALIKDKSDMQELAVPGIGRFDTTSGRVLSEDNRLEVLLVLLGENIFESAKPKNTNVDPGVMFREVKRQRHFELVE